MKTIEEMEEVNIYSDVSEQRSEWSFLSGLLRKHLTTWTSSLYKP